MINGVLKKLAWCALGLIALIMFLALTCGKASAHSCSRNPGYLYYRVSPYTGWSTGCYACHPQVHGNSNGGTYTYNSATSTTKATIDGDDYRHGKMLEIAKSKQKSINMIKEAQALGLTGADLSVAGLAPGQYGANVLLQYATPGLGLWGSTQYNQQLGQYSVGANWSQPRVEAATSERFIERALVQTAGLLQQAMTTSGNYAAADKAAAHQNSIELARMMVVLEGVRRAKEAPPSNTTVTSTWGTSATNGGANQNGGPAEKPLPDGANNGDQFGRAMSNLGNPPQVVIDNCNQCHVAQKKVLIGPDLTDRQARDALRRILLPDTHPDHMPKKPSPALDEAAGMEVMRYLTGVPR